MEERKEDLKLTAAVKTITEILKKHGFTQFSFETLNDAMQKMSVVGNKWYHEYEALCKFSDNDLIYNRAAYHSCTESVDAYDEEFVKYESNYDIISALALSKLVSESLTQKIEARTKGAIQISRHIDDLEMECEAIRDSYADAGISEFILDEFVAMQSTAFNEKRGECLSCEKQLRGVEKSKIALSADEKKLTDAVEVVETQSKLKYYDDDYRELQYRYNYKKNVQALMDKYSDKVKI